MKDGAKQHARNAKRELKGLVFIFMVGVFLHEAFGVIVNDLLVVIIDAYDSDYNIIKYCKNDE